MARDGFRTIAAPPEGIYRVARQPDPLALPPPTAADLGDHRAGNRFDSFLGTYGVLYLATELDTCFEETLSRLVPRPHLAELVRQQWQDLHFMNPGAVAREWRNDRRIVRATVPDDARFVDVDHPDTLATLERLTRPTLQTLGVDELDTATIRDVDRRVTRFLSQIIWAVENEQGYGKYAGVRYASRVDGRECWAVFDRAHVTPRQIRVIFQTEPALVRVATRRGLTVH